MDALIPTLSQEFHRKGLYPGLLPGLLNDIDAFFGNHIHHSLHRLNLELEELGWGISVIEQQIYERILKVYHTRHSCESTDN
jgi:hypothetical protein